MFKLVTSPMQPNALFGMIFDEPLALVTLFIPFAGPKLYSKDDTRASSIIATVAITVS